MKKFIKGLVLALILIGVYSSSASAVSRTSWGNRDASYYAGGSDTGYQRSLSGATWYYYEINSTAFSEDQTVAIPFNSRYNDKVAIPVGICQSYGGFWVLLRNEYKMTGDGVDGTTGILTNRPAVPVNLSDIGTGSLATNMVVYKSPNDFPAPARPQGEENGAISAIKYGTMDEVKNDFQSLVGTTAIPAGATLDQGNFSYFCYGPNRPERENFTTFSTVSTSEYSTSTPVKEGTSYLGQRQDGSSTSTSLLVPEGSTLNLTFNHYLAKKSPAGNFDNNATVQIESIARYINGVESAIAPSTNPLPLDSMSRERIRVDGIDYYVASSEQSLSQEITSDMTICETITFKKASYSTAQRNNNDVQPEDGIISSTACISVRPVPSTGVNLVTDCEQGGNAQYAGRRPYPGKFGNIVATVGVTLNGELKMTTAGAHSSQADPLLQKNFYKGSTATVYGKPGDVVQFSYALCFGAPISGAFPPADMVNFAAPNVENHAIGAVFEVGIGASATEYQPQFLFGRATGILGQSDIEVNNAKIKDTASFDHAAFVYHGDVADTMTAEEAVYVDITHEGNDKPQIIFASPDSKPKTVPADLSENDEEEMTGQFNGDYSCLFYDGLSSNHSGITQGGYQINGIQQDASIDYNCASASLAHYDGAASAASTGSIVGASISQTLNYSFTAAWPAMINGKAYTGFSGVLAGGYTQVDDIEEAAKLYEEAYSAYSENGGTSSGIAFHLDNNSSAPVDKLSKTATVAIPYNFDTDLSLAINDNSQTVEAGDEISLSAHVDILPRTNPLTSDVDDNGDFIPYATITPPDTKVQIIEMLISDEAKLDNELADGQTVKDILDGKFTYDRADICNRLTKVLGSNIGSGACWARTVKGYKAETVSNNPDGGKDPKGGTELGNNLSDPAGEMNYYNDSDIKREVPDAEAGYKYCVAIGINHGDSHNVSGQSLSVHPYLDADGNETDEIDSGQIDADGNPTKNKDNPNFGANSYSVNGNLTTEAPHTWKVSGFSCRSIIKKPNFTVWNGGVYSGGDINTSTTVKAPNTRFAEEKIPEEKVFGSWAEYFIISKGSVAGMASASGLGFSSQYTWKWETTTTDANGKQTITPHQATGFQPLSWTSGAKRNGNNEYSLDDIASGLKEDIYASCIISHLTIANAECDSKRMGNYASGDTDNSVMESHKQRILKYYTDETATATLTGLNNKYSSSVDSDILPEVNGAKYLKVDGNIDIDQIIHQKNGVLVIHATGHININENICLGETGGLCLDNANIGGINNWDDLVGRFQDENPNDANTYAKYVYDKVQNANNTSLEYRNWTQFDGSKLDIPQVIIIADSISISGNVSQVDAWLVTNSDTAFNTEFSGGYVNTCKEFRDGETGTDNCWKTLKINGPVITSALMLNRTGGAWAGLTGDIGSQTYDILKIVYEHYYETWLNEGRCDKSCQEKKQSFFESLGDDLSPANRAYNAISYYSADKGAIASGRTYSRDLTCDGSLTPAEIFDLHPIVYYWALAESQKSHQAIVTYAQEFAPRY